MSRIGRMPIAIPAGVTVDIAENNKVTVKGPKGTLERVLPSEMELPSSIISIFLMYPSSKRICAIASFILEDGTSTVSCFAVLG